MRSKIEALRADVVKLRIEIVAAKSTILEFQHRARLFVEGVKEAFWGLTTVIESLPQVSEDTRVVFPHSAGQNFEGKFNATILKTKTDAA